MEINWETVKEYEDITYKKCNGVARIAINRAEVRNAFRPKTTSELYDAFYHVSEDSSVGVVLLTGEGPSKKDGGHAFCSGGDQKAPQLHPYKPPLASPTTFHAYSALSPTLRKIRQQ